MSSKKLFTDLSANTVQTGITQLAGILIFYVLSRYISKDDFGAYNWATAVGATIIAVGSLGLDLVLVKRIASGENPSLMAGIHFFHTIVVGLVILLAFFFLQIIVPGLLQYHPLFVLVLVQLSITNIANSFKFSLTGLEAFKSLAVISVVLSIAKFTVVFLLLLGHFLSIKNIVLGFLLSSLIEVAFSYYFVNQKINGTLIPLLRKDAYKGFILESLPQLGVVLFDSALARVDWILLGIFSTMAITADYNFAYKFFELSKLPLLILSPILLTRFSRLFANNENITIEKQQSIQQFLNLELFISMLIPIFMVCVWTDLIDLLTENKYGAINQTTYTILAFCVPLHFVINFLWTMGFVQGQLKAIMCITIGSSLLNLLVNIILIPRLGSSGAAISFLLSSIVQAIVYFFVVTRQRIKIDLKFFLSLLLTAVVAVVFAKWIFHNNYIAAFAACLFYISFAVLTKQASLSVIKTFANRK